MLFALCVSSEFFDVGVLPCPFVHCGFFYRARAKQHCLFHLMHFQLRCGRTSLSHNSKITQWIRLEKYRKQCLSDCLPGCTVKFVVYEFDCSLGFPGEGPSDDKPWSLISANIGSLFSHVGWKAWEDHVICLQESRIGKNNVRNARFEVSNCGKHLFHGELLPGVISVHGYKRTPHGGTAIVGPPQTTKYFSFDEDATGKYKPLFLSKRVVACWVQILPRVRALIFSLYAQTGASSDSNIHEKNDKYLHDMFEIASQFGDIPVIFAADLQDEPLTYASVSNAIHFNQWVDPLLLLNDDGSVSRDLTFSNDRSFSGGSDGCSSIDAVLVNKVAACALKKAEILQTFNTQHRPIRVTFDWPAIHQVGYILRKPAPFVLDECTTTGHAAQQIAEELWEQDFVDQFNSHDSVECKWRCANDFCIETLIRCGAKWGKGAQDRGQKPRFQLKKICPGQNPNGSSITLLSSWQQNALRSLQEIRCRFARPTHAGADFHDLQRTLARLRRRLEAVRCPFVWLPWQTPDLCSLQACETWLVGSIRDTDAKLKRARINRWRDKIRESANSNAKCIFRHLRNKTRDEPANLVEDDAGNIVYSPSDALDIINSRWDDVFSANVLHDHPTRMLQTIWPYIRDHSLECELPDITGQHLHAVVARRNPDASPGLDGWRTRELQSLPSACFAPFALMFKTFEQTDEELPDNLVCAKQLILNKNGSSDAMQKRLITVLPIMLLAYTGARFQQLQKWQQNFLPAELQGGIKGRKMESIPVELQLQLDEARKDKTSLLGLKLDKSKCFDRIVPSFAAALMLSFGVPKNVIRVFTKLYAKLHRHLSYKSWIAPKPTHAANGVAQGCSFSLIAINVYMAAWTFMVQRLPGLYVRVFIDDSYMWTSLSNKQILATAFQVTQNWDELSGQKMNVSKCTSWGSNALSRTAIKNLFPNMHFAFAFDVLGTLIVTDDKMHCHLTDAKVNKIVLDSRNIAVLPLKNCHKTKLLGAKVLPQATFGAMINLIPKQVTERVTSAVAHALWNGRPHWRSKFLVVGLLSKAHRVDITLAKAYNTILDFMRSLQTVINLQQRCVALFDSVTCSKRNLMRNVIEAFNVFGLSLDNRLAISFHGSTSIALTELHTKDLKRLLAALAANSCYHKAQIRVRKDFVKPTGVLDLELSRSSVSKLKKIHYGKLPATALFDAAQIGCFLTNDRLCAAKLIDTPDCRFCGCQKESTPHLVFECHSLHRQIGSPQLHDFGPNFAMLGIVEHPLGFIRQRLKWSSPSSLHVTDLIKHDVTLPLWTDGSVLGNFSFWTAAGAFAIVDVAGKVIRQGPVYHWGLSSFSTELWAVINAAALADAHVHIFTDCKTVVDLFQTLVGLDEVPCDWSHREWWVFLFQLWDMKFNRNVDALKISWIPAHCLENVPIEWIGDDLARSCRSTVLDIFCNRCADFAAKSTCIDHAPLHAERYHDFEKHILVHHKWLVELASKLGHEHEEQILRQSDEPGPSQDEDDLEQTIRSFFHKWPWNPPAESLPWTPPRIEGVCKPACWKNSADDWMMFLHFLKSLRWDSHASLSWSYFELACIFHLRGFAWEDVDPLTFRVDSLVPKVKKACIAVRKSAAHILLPGSHNPDRNKSIGKTLPSGTIDGVNLRCSSDELLKLGRFIFHGGNHRLGSWAFALCDLN